MTVNSRKPFETSCFTLKTCVTVSLLWQIVCILKEINLFLVANTGHCLDSIVLWTFDRASEPSVVPHRLLQSAAGEQGAEGHSGRAPVCSGGRSPPCGRSGDLPEKCRAQPGRGPETQRGAAKRHSAVPHQRATSSHLTVVFRLASLWIQDFVNVNAHINWFWKIPSSSRDIGLFSFELCLVFKINYWLICLCL